MSLLFNGPKGSLEQRWIVYALLRDNVQHHLEQGRPSARFAALHGIALAMRGAPVRIDARHLHDELLQADEALCSRSVAALAVGARTRAVIELSFPFPEGDKTMLARDCDLSLPSAQTARTLADVFGHLIGDLLRITSGAGPDDQVEVVDL